MTVGMNAGLLGENPYTGVTKLRVTILLLGTRATTAVGTYVGTLVQSIITTPV